MTLNPNMYHCDLVNFIMLSLVPLDGIKPPTSCLQDRRYYQLSYSGLIRTRYQVVWSRMQVVYMVHEDMANNQHEYRNLLKTRSLGFVYFWISANEI